jgi:hypothetical protein
MWVVPCGKIIISKTVCIANPSLGYMLEIPFRLCLFTKYKPQHETNPAA